MKNGFINEYRKKKKQPQKVDFEDVIAYQESDEDNGIVGFDLGGYPMSKTYVLGINIGF